MHGVDEGDPIWGGCCLGGGVVSAIPSVHPFFNNVGYCLNFDILVYWQKTTSLQ